MAAKREAQASSEFIIFNNFNEGMNTQSSRQDLSEKAAAWMENLQPIAANKLQGVPGPSDTPIHAFGSTPAVKLFYFDLGVSTDYIIVAFSDGSLSAVTNPGGTVTAIAPVGTFSAQGPDAANWLGDRLLFADSRGGYSTWDGNVFVQQGGVSPNFAVTLSGSGYFSGATVVISGGSGTGATAKVTVSAGAVVGIVLLTPGTGYIASDTLTVTINPVNGQGTGATANGHVWPFVSPNPTTVAVAFGRVWLATGKTLITSGTGSATFGDAYDDFSSGDASVTTTISDTDLIHAITVLRYLNGYLYIFGDNSVKFIGSITVSGGVTNFTITPLSSDQGTTFPNTVLSYNRLVLFANNVGVFAVFGASVEKISDPMDGVFQNVVFTTPLSSGVVDLNNIHTYALLVQYRDPAQGLRALLLCYMNRKWFVANQGAGALCLTTGFVNGQSFLYGAVQADSTECDVDQMFVSTDMPVPYKLQTSLTSHKNPINDKRVFRAGVAQTVTALSDLALVVESENDYVSVPLANQSVDLIFVNSSGQSLNFTNSQGQTLVFAGRGFVASRSSEFNVTGRWVGATLTGTLNGIVLQAVMLEYAPDGAPWGSK